LDGYSTSGLQTEADAGPWSGGNENWEFTAGGLMQRRIASINDLPIAQAYRKYRCP
jgi:nuclear transport factor 2 (NTF2) superfamily protein